MLRWSFWTIVFLILLRLSIGWHFLFEGLNKVHSYLVGPTVTSRPFTSGPYFREAPGPLGQLFRATNGDPDNDILARVVPTARPENFDPATDKPQDRLPPALKADWYGLADRYAKHYGISANEARAVVEQNASITVRWLEYEPPPELQAIVQRFGKIESVDVSLLTPAETAIYNEFLANSTDQTIRFVSGEVTRRMTMAERVAAYREKLADYRERSGRKAWIFGKDVDAAHLRAIKSELAAWRTALRNDLDNTQTARLVLDLNTLVLGDRAEKLAALPAGKELLKLPQTPLDLKAFAESVRDKQKQLETQGKTAEAESLASVLEGLATTPALPALSADPLVAWIDFLTIWGLTLMGACILVGLLTRLSCWAAAGFLLLTYLAVPSWPWLPSVGPQEGNYFLVNKNVVEMFALCVLGTLPTGRWFGADGLLLAMWSFLTGSAEEESNEP
ncbi:MAG: DoxX family protein [Gemmataceae bacterium]